MANKKNNIKNEIELSKENLLIQPLALTLIGANPTVTGNRVSLAIVKKMQDAFKEIISGRKSGKSWDEMSVFATEEVKNKFLHEGDLLFDIHVNELVTERSYYRKAFNAACQLADIKVWIPVLDKDGSVSKIRKSLFTILLKNTQYEERDSKTGEVTFGYKKNTHPIIGFIMEHAVAEYVFSFQKKYGDFLDSPVFASNEKYFPPLYIFVSAHKYDRAGEFTIDYMEFRRILGFEDKEGEKMKYSTYAQFYNWVIKPTETALREMAAKNEVDCFFDIEKIYNNNQRASNPDRLKFIIHLSNLGKSMKSDKYIKSELIGIEKRLRNEFGQTESQISMLMRKVPQYAITDLNVKLDQLIELKMSGKINVERNWGSYVNRSLCAWLESITSQKTLNFEESEEPKESKNNILEKVGTEEVDTVLKGLWENFLNQVSCDLDIDLFETWISPIVPVSFKENELVLRLPSATFAEMLNINCYKKMMPAFYSVFGSTAKIKYIL